MDHVDTRDGAVAAAEAATAEVLARVPAGRTLLDKWRFVMAAVADPDLSANAKAMLPVILDEYQDARGYARRGYRYLASKAGMAERTARRAVLDLVVAGYVQKRVDRRGSASEVNQYRPCWGIEKVVRPVPATPPRDDVWPQLATGGGVYGHRGEAHLADKLPLDSFPLTPEVSRKPSGKTPVAAAQQQVGPALASRDDDRPKARHQPADRIALPDGCPFDPADIASRSDLTAADVAAAEASFREKTAGDKRIATEWARTAKAWLGIQKPAAAQADTKGTLLPSPFIVTPEMADFAREQGLTKSEADEATRAFCDQCRSATGFKALSRDWEAEWRGAIRREVKSRKRPWDKPKNSFGGNMAI